MQNSISVSSVISIGSYDCKWFLSYNFAKQFIGHYSKHLQYQRNFRLYWTSGVILKWRIVAFYNWQPTKINTSLSFKKIECYRHIIYNLNNCATLVLPFRSTAHFWCKYLKNIYIKKGKMTNKEGETTRIETTQGEWGKGEMIWHCQRWVELFASGQSELLACLPTVTVSNSLRQCSIQDVGHAQSKINYQHKCYRSWTVSIMINFITDSILIYVFRVVR